MKYEIIKEPSNELDKFIELIKNENTLFSELVDYVNSNMLNFKNKYILLENYEGTIITIFNNHCKISLMTREEIEEENEKHRQLEKENKVMVTEKNGRGYYIPPVTDKKIKMEKFLCSAGFKTYIDFQKEIITDTALRDEVIKNNLFILLNQWAMHENFSVETLGDKKIDYLLYLMEKQEFEILKELVNKVPIKEVITGTKTILDMIIECNLEKEEKEELINLYREKGALTSDNLVLIESNDNRSFQNGEESLLEKKTKEIMNEYNPDYNRLFNLIASLLLSENFQNLKRFLELFRKEYNENLMTFYIPSNFFLKTKKYNFFDFFIEYHFQKGYSINMDSLEYLMRETSKFSDKTLLKILDSKSINGFPEEKIKIYLNRFNTFVLLENYYLTNDKILENEFFQKYLTERINIVLQKDKYKYSYIYTESFLEINLISIYSFLNKGILNGAYYKNRAKKILELYTEYIKNLSRDEILTLFSFKDSLGRSLLHESFIFKDEPLIKIIAEKLKNDNDSYFDKDNFGNTPLDYLKLFHKDAKIEEIAGLKPRINENNRYKFLFTPSITDNILNFLVASLNKPIYLETNPFIVPATNTYDLFKDRLSVLKNDTRFKKTKLDTYKHIAELTDNINFTQERSLKKYLQDTFGEESKKTLTMLERLGYSIVRNDNKSELVVKSIRENISDLSKECLTDINDFIIDTLYVALKDVLFIDENSKISIEKRETTEDVDLEIEKIDELIKRAQEDLAKTDNDNEKKKINKKLKNYQDRKGKKEKYKKRIEDNEKTLKPVEPLSFLKFKEQFNLAETYHNVFWEIGKDKIDIDFFEDLSKVTMALYGEDIIKLFEDLVLLRNLTSQAPANDEMIFEEINKEIRKYEMCKVDRKNKIAIIPDTLNEKYHYFLKAKDYSIETYNTQSKSRLFGF